MGLAMSTYDAMLKEFYLPLVQESLNNEVLLKKYLEESGKSFSGRRVIFPVHYSRNTGVGARAEAAALPTAGNQGHYNAYITAAYIYGRLDITGQTKAASKTGFADALANEMEGLKTDIVKDLSRQAYGEGNGILAQGSTTTATLTSVYVMNQFAEPGQPGARFIEVGEKIDLGAIGSPSAISNQSVVAVSIAANSGTLYDTVTISASINMSASAFVFRYNAGGTGLEIKGIRALIDDQTASNCYNLSGGMFNNATIFNIDRNSVKNWNCYVDQNSGTVRIIDSYLMQKAFSGIKKKSGKEVDICYGEYDVMDAFLDSVASDRRFASKNFDAGMDSLTFNGKQLVKDQDAPYNELFLIKKDALNWYTELPLEFADDDGSILKNVAGYDRWEAFMRAYIQLGFTDSCMPAACGCIRDIRTQL